MRKKLAGDWPRPASWLSYAPALLALAGATLWLRSFFAKGPIRPREGGG
jgi:hypothetical protein